MVRHRHFTLNGHKCNIPSAIVKPGDVVQVKDKSRQVAKIVESLNAIDRRGVPSWLELDKEQCKGAIATMPHREELTLPMREHLIVELYSK